MAEKNLNAHSEAFVSSKPGVAPIPPRVDGNNQTHQGATGNNAGGNAGATPRTDRPRVIDLNSLMNRTVTASGLSAKGREYVDTLKHELANQSSAKEKIRIEPLGQPSEALVAICGNYAIILLFSEAVVNQSSTRPAISYNGEAKNQLRAMYGETLVPISTIVVTPQDYERPAHMAAELCNEFLGVMDPDLAMMSIHAFNDNALTFTTDLNLINQFLQKNDPHGIPDRNDLVLGICASPKRAINNQYYQINQPEVPEGSLIAVVTGYTTFVANDSANAANTGKSHIPVVHISRIVTPLQCEAILPMIIGLVYERWIFDAARGLGWRVPYTKIGKDIPNIGSLWQDPNTGGAMRAENIAQVHDFCNKFLTDPILTLDVVAGRAHVPGLEKFCIRESYGDLLADLGKFFAGDPNAFMGACIPARPMFTEIVGQHLEGGRYEDTRYIDYLNRVEKMGLSSVGTCAQLLTPNLNLDTQFNLIKSLVPSAEPLYLNSWVKIEPQMVQLVLDLLRRNVQIQTVTTSQGVCNFSDFVDPANVVYGGMQNGYGGFASPFNQAGWCQPNNVF